MFLESTHVAFGAHFFNKTSGVLLVGVGQCKDFNEAQRGNMLFLFSFFSLSLSFFFFLRVSESSLIGTKTKENTICENKKQKVTLSLTRLTLFFLGGFQILTEPSRNAFLTQGPEENSETRRSPTPEASRVPVDTWLLMVAGQQEDPPPSGSEDHLPVPSRGRQG